MLAHASDSEAEEAEEEPQEGEEEAATAEVEAEEAEGGEDMSPTGSDGAGSAAVSNLKLTTRARAALAHRLPTASTVSFSFTLSTRAKVHVTIARQMSSGRQKHWDMLPDTLALSLTPGQETRSLKGRNRLSAGHYRLTVKPTGGHSRSIYLSVQP